MQEFKLSDNWVKYTVYADDVSPFLDGIENDLQETCSILEAYGKLSGLKFNSSKCTILGVGPLETSEIVLCKERQFK